MELLIVIIFPIVFSILAYFALKNFKFGKRTSKQYLDGEYIPATNDELVNVDWFEKVLKRQYYDYDLKTLDFIGGELNCKAYSKIKPWLEERINKDKTNVTIVFGKYICVEDELIKARYNSSLNIHDCHPIFELKNKYPENIRLFHSFKKRQEVHSGVANDDRAVIEETHAEIFERAAIFYVNNNKIAENVKENINRLINSQAVTEIQDVDKFDRNYLISYSELKNKDEAVHGRKALADMITRNLLESKLVS